MTTPARYRGVFPVVPTTFTEAGELDLPSQKRCVDFMIDAGSNGICILANFSEQFVLGDDERELLTKTILAHVAGRVPVIVNCENRQGGLLAAKALMHEGGVIACEAPRHPFPAMHPANVPG